MDIKVNKGMKRGGLVDIFKERGFTTGVEIGVCIGKFSEVMASKMPELTLYSVDPFMVVYNDYRTMRLGEDNQEEIFQKASDRLSPYENCKIVRKTSLEAAMDFPYESIDFVYIDGSHEFDYVMCDIIEWGKRVKKGGIISGHDYYKFRFSGVTTAVDTYAREHRVKTINLTDEGTPTWWFERTW